MEIVIYFLRSLGNGAIKIGYTKAVASRVASIRKEHPEGVEVLGIMPGGFNLEASIHTLFESTRIEGEWFDPSEDLLDYVARNATHYDESTGLALEVSTRKAVYTPKINRALSALGERLRLARMRRNLSAELLAERSGMSRTTYRGVERGEPSVAFGKYVAVLHSLGLLEELDKMAEDDELGRKLQDIQLLGRRSRRRG